MKKYIYTKTSNLLVVENEDLKNFSVKCNNYGSIDWMWCIEDDGEFIFENETYEVKAGDIVLCLYNEFRGNEKRHGRTIAVVQNKVWYDNMKALEARENEERPCDCTKCPCAECIAEDPETESL